MKGLGLRMSLQNPERTVEIFSNAMKSLRLNQYEEIQIITKGIREVKRFSKIISDQLIIAFLLIYLNSISYQINVREQRSSSEDSITKLLQSAPLIHEEEEDDDGFAISKESYSKLSKMKAQMVFSETELGVRK